MKTGQKLDQELVIVIQSEKLNYISNFNWIDNWVERYFFNKVSDLIYSLIFISMVFLANF